MELLRTDRLLLRHRSNPTSRRSSDVYSREDVVRWLGTHPRRPLTTQTQSRERLGMTGQGMTERWFGLTARQYLKVLSPPES